MLALKTELMLEEYEKKKQKQISSMRSWLDYGRGIFFAGTGILLIFFEKLKIPIDTDKISPNAIKALGLIFALYGVWRIYRAYKKNYFQ